MTNINIASIPLMVFLWQLGVVDSLTLFQFCLNCGAQYTGLTLGEAAGCLDDIGPGVILAPIAGLGTSYKYVRAAQSPMEVRSRIATLAAFMAMSGRATLTDPATNAAAGGTIATFIAHMKAIIAKSNSNGGGLVFIHPFSKLTRDEEIVFNVVIIGGVGLVIIIISYYVIPRVARAYWRFFKKSAKYTISSVENRIDHLKKSKKLKKLGQKIFIPLKYFGFIENGALKLVSYSWSVSKIIL